MYNETIKNIKNQYRIPGTKVCVNARNLRTNILRDIRDQIIEDSQLPNIDKNTRIKTHILDTAIQLACANYKSALTNFKKGNIKHFRIRYWKYHRCNRILEIEPSFFSKNSICPKVFGIIKATYDNKNFDLQQIHDKYKSACKLTYNAKERKYVLYVPMSIHTKQNNNENNFISIDPGIRTFLTGISENSAVEIGTNLLFKVQNYLERIDTANEKLNKKKRRKKILLYRRKIKNIVEDLHWKSIKYLTSNYRNILIGDMSVKSIVNNKNSKLSNIIKRISHSMCLYKFKQRLLYKCQINMIHYKEIDERYTSKMCSNCGWMNNELGCNKTFECRDCKIKMDRDFNGSRGIYLKHYM